MTKQSYRITLYLGKEIYENLTDLANMMGMKTGQLAKVIFTTGYALSQAIEKKSNETLKGDSK